MISLKSFRHPRSSWVAPFLFALGITALSAVSTPAARAGQGDDGVQGIGSLFSWAVSEPGIDIDRGIVFGPHPRHRLDVYRAKLHGSPSRASNTERSAPPSSPPTVAMFIYGGSWRDGERATYRFVGSALAARGITTVIPDYRLFPDVTFPGFVDDAALAYKWVADHFKALSPSNQSKPKACAQSARIVLIGHSAGAHIAAMLALDQRFLAQFAPGAEQPAGLVGLAGPYSFDPTTWPSTRDVFIGATNADAARPVAFARPGAPPALLMHGSDDTTVKLFNQRDLAAALRGHGNHVEAIEIPGLAHVGLVLAISQPFRWRAPQVLDRTIAFIREIDAQNLGTTLCR